MSKRKKRAPQGGRRPGPVQPNPARARQHRRCLLDIVMPVFGEIGLAVKAIEHVEAAARPLEPTDYRMIVCDNGTPPWIPTGQDQPIPPEELFRPVTALIRPGDVYFRIEDNCGYPGGVNACVDKGDSPLILILTSDVILEPGAINALVRSMDDPSVSVAAPKLLFPLDMESPHGPGGTIQHAGLAFDIRGKPYHVHIGWSADHPKANVRRDMAAVSGACFITRRNLWREIGGFDLRYGMGTFEDMDYCFSVRALGGKVIYEPTAVGFHLVSGARLQGANARGFNVPLNETIFRGKWATHLAWDEWRYL